MEQYYVHTGKVDYLMCKLVGTVEGNLAIILTWKLAIYVMITTRKITFRGTSLIYFIRHYFKNTFTFIAEHMTF